MISLGELAEHKRFVDAAVARIAALEAQLAEARKLADGIHSYLDSHWCQCGELPEDQEWRLYT